VPPRSGTATAVRIGALRLSGPAKIVLLITVLAAALRFATLNVQSIWLDEAATIVLVHRGVAGMLSHLSASESAPPLYYLLVWTWTKVFGAGPLGFRSLSALVGALTVPVLYLAGRRVSPRVGVWAAALAAVNPAMYYYSQESRAYGLLILFSAAAFVMWQRALQSPSGRRVALWGLFSILALLSHYFAVFLFLPEAFLLIRRLGWQRVWIAASAVVVVGVALAPLAIAQHGSTRKSEWIEETSLASRVLETAKLFLVGVYGPLETVTAALAGLLVIGAIVLLLRYADADARGVARDAAIVALVALAIPLLAAATHALDVFDGRNVIATWVPCCVVVAIGLGVSAARPVALAIGAALCAVSLAVVVGINVLPAYQREDWRDAAHALPAIAGPRVIVSAGYSRIPLSVYLRSPERLEGHGVPTKELDFIGLATKGANGAAPAPPVVPTSAPQQFRLAGVRRSEAYAVSRFLAARPTTVPFSLLRRMSGEPAAEVILQR
jgi:uncharacterized membrane protein